MGITTALNTSVGSYPLKYFKMYKLLVAAAVAVCVSAEADPGVLVAAPALYNAYPNWPGVSTPYSSSTCYGCRPGYLHKRSADAEAEPGYLAYGYGLRPYAYGYHLAGVAAHPGLATSFEARSPQGLRGKRSAEPGYALYGYHGVPIGLPYHGAVHGISQLHPGAAHSFQHVARGKRSADADADAYYGYGYGYPYGYAHHGYGYAHHGYHLGYGYGYYG